MHDEIAQSKLYAITNAKVSDLILMSSVRKNTTICSKKHEKDLLINAHSLLTYFNQGMLTELRLYNNLFINSLIMFNTFFTEWTTPTSVVKVSSSVYVISDSNYFRAMNGLFVFDCL